jgi:hypothetical protein
MCVKLLIHFISNDTSGHNNLVGHMSGGQPKFIYQDCRCLFDDLSSTHDVGMSGSGLVAFLGVRAGVASVPMSNTVSVGPALACKVRALPPVGVIAATSFSTATPGPGRKLVTEGFDLVGEGRVGGVCVDLAYRGGVVGLPESIENCLVPPPPRLLLTRIKDYLKGTY